MTTTVPEIVLVPISGRRWRVNEVFIVQTEMAGTVVIPKNFVCDLNSIPRFLWFEATPTDYPEAGAVHDWLYYLQVPRDVADKVYLEILLASGMGRVRANARYYALRTFGAKAYANHTKAKREMDEVKAWM